MRGGPSPQDAATAAAAAAAGHSLSAGASNGGGGGGPREAGGPSGEAPGDREEEAEEEEAYKLSRIAASQSATPSDALNGRAAGCSTSRQEHQRDGEGGSQQGLQREAMAGCSEGAAALTGAVGTTPQPSSIAAAPASAAAVATAAATAALASDRTKLLSEMEKELTEAKVLMSREMLLPNKLCPRPNGPPPPDSAANNAIPPSAVATAPPSSTPLSLSDTAELAAFLEGRRCTLSVLVDRLVTATGGAAEAEVRVAVAELAARKSYAAKEGGECFSENRREKKPLRTDMK